MVKRLVELIFFTGINRPKLSKWKHTSPQVFNGLFMNIQVPREFSRRVQNIDTGTVKAQKFRNLILFFFFFFFFF